MKIILTGILSLFFLINSKAQFKSATIGIDGLTCSMCSNSAERLLRQLDFVEDVKMDLNATTCYITFRKGNKVKIYKLADKVKDAGFSVRMITAVFNFEAMSSKEGEAFIFEEDEYIFIKTSGKELKGETSISFIGKKYVPKREYSQWAAILSSYKKAGKGKKQIYYITL
jgi:copper chaperone CopZ